MGVKISSPKLKVVDRGDAAIADFTVAGFNKNGFWQDLNLSAIIPATAKWVYIKVAIAHSLQASQNLTFRTKGFASSGNSLSQSTQAAGITMYMEGWVYIDPANPQTIQYNASSVASWSIISLTVRGWIL